MRRNEPRWDVPEMPEEQQKARAGRGNRSGEDYSVAISPTGTQQHQPQRRRMPRLAREVSRGWQSGLVDSRGSIVEGPWSRVRRARALCEQEGADAGCRDAG